MRRSKEERINTMGNATTVDKNFQVWQDFDKSKLDFYDVLEAPLQVHGLIFPEAEGDYFRRIPKELAKQVNEGVLALHEDSAGGRVRFRTNATQIALFAEEGNVEVYNHFALTGSCGFDMYAGARYVNTFRPPSTIVDGFAALLEIPPEVPHENGEREITINFPLYSHVKKVTIGVNKGATMKAPKAYKYPKPIVYYGSSITQGGCASRPGNSYQAIISRKLDCEYINLGFSGSARAELPMAEYIANLDMEIFVYDYDHNADSPEYLNETHQRMFKIIREKNPELPVVMVSRPRYYNEDEDTRKRLAVIKRTYDEAVAAGDKNVYYIDGGEMMHKYCDDCGTVDGIHPNDHGFVAMAKGIGEVLEKILKA